MSKKPQPPRKTPQPAVSDDAVYAALDARDSAGIIAFLGQGLTPDWRDDRGRTLVHYAAAWDDEDFYKALKTAGATVAVYDDNAETPRDLATAWGHDALAAKMAMDMAAAPATTAPLSARNLGDIRRETSETLVDQFNYLVRVGRLDAVLALAAQPDGGLTAADLLGRGMDGDTTLLKICQQGALGKLFNVNVWRHDAEQFQQVWSNVPDDYRKGHDPESFNAQLRQAKLQSFGKIKLRGATPPPPKG